LGADERRLSVRRVDMAEYHVDDAHRAFEHRLIAVALFERIAAGCNDDDTLPALDLARKDEIRQRKSLRLSLQTGARADLPNVVVSLDNDEIVRPLGGRGSSPAHARKQCAAGNASERVAPGNLVR